MDTSTLGALHRLVGWFPSEPVLEPLSKSLPEAIRNAHTLIHANPFVKKLTTGDFLPTVYIAYLCMHYVIHSELEEAEEAMCAELPKFTPIRFPELFRSPHIANDLSAWAFLLEKPYQCSFSKEELLREVRAIVHAISPKGGALAAHIRSSCQREPSLAVASMYIFYGGLLAGGQIIKKRVEERYDSFSPNFRPYPASAVPAEDFLEEN